MNKETENFINKWCEDENWQSMMLEDLKPLLQEDWISVEDEIQERINFKMNELVTVLENRIGIEWKISFNNMSQKHTNYWEAFKDLKKMVIKERDMSTPCDNMAERRMNKSKDMAVEKFVALFNLRGQRDYQSKVSNIVNIIEELWQPLPKPPITKKRGGCNP